MREVEIKEIEVIWDELCVLMSEAPRDTQGLKLIYGRLLEFLGFLGAKKAASLEILQRVEKEMEAEKFVQDTRGMVMKGFHYKERDYYRRLKGGPEVKTQALLDRLDGFFSMAVTFERVLQSYYKVMMLDMKLSMEGHS